MSLVIAVVMIVLVVFIVGGEKINSVPVNINTRTFLALHNNFERRYCDEEIETQLRHYLKNEESEEEIREELEKMILESGVTWDMSQLIREGRDYADGKALHILLANRGKIYSFANCGYPTRYNVKNGNKPSEEDMNLYKYVRWIQNTLAKQDINLDLKYKYNKFGCEYVWIGSAGSCINSDEELIDLDQLFNIYKLDIPKPYFEK